MRLSIILFIVIIGLTSFNFKTESKINGLSFVSTNSSIDHTNVEPIISLNANYVAIIPFGFVSSLNDPNLTFNSKHQWYGETTAGISQYTEEFRKGKLKLMMKPQIWVMRGEYCGHIEMKTEKEWQKLEQSYTNFILHYAAIAEKLKTEIFCIGTEMDYFQTNRPQYWVQVIKKIKTKYSGKITYAANWDEYKRVKFWKDLDYIGVDAYFPLSNKKTPTETDCTQGWKKYKEELKGISLKNERPILFTEFGYCSSDSAAHEPWRSDRRKINLLGQLNATNALFTSFWDEEWFAGGFIWKWFHDYENSGGIGHAGHTPQNKPVENIIRQRYLK